VFLLPVLSY